MLDSLLQFFRNLGTARLILFVGLIGFVVLTLNIMVGSQSSPLAVLYANLSPQDANSVIQQLEAENVSYKIEGSTIRVPRNQVDRLRITLAERSITGGVVGNEIFDKESSFGQTTMELNFNRLRAIEGELTRTIRAFRSVSEVRVHISLPERTPFAQSRAEPSASIVIRPRTGGLSPGQASAIQSIVAGAVPMLTPDNVAISDIDGRLLADGQGSDEIGAFSTLDEARVARENLYMNRVRTMLEKTLGQGRVDVRVALEMDMVRETTQSTIFDPDAAVVAGSTVREQSAVEAKAGSQGVTIGNNDPTAGGGEQGQPVQSQDNVTEETTNFLNSSTQTTQVKEPGRITALNVAVIVDQQRLDPDNDPDTPDVVEPWPQAQMDAFQALVTNSLPRVTDATGAVIDPVITVQQLAFAKPPEIESSGTALQILGFAPEDFLGIVQGGGLIIVAILFLMVVVRPIVMRIIEAIPEAPPPPDPNAPIEAEVRPEPMAISGPQDISAELLARAAQGDELAAAAVLAARESGDLDMGAIGTDSRIDVAQVEGRIQESALKKVAEIIRSNPDDSVSIIRSWLYSE